MVAARRSRSGARGFARPLVVAGLAGAALYSYGLQGGWGLVPQPPVLALAALSLALASCALLRDERQGLIAVTLLFGLLLPVFASGRGQDANWDQLNYHVGNAHLFLTDTYRWHIAPSQLQTWLNPLPYVFQYLVAESFGSVAYALLSAALAAVSAPLVYLIAIELQEPHRLRPHLAFVAASVGLTGPMFLSEAGTTMVDAWAAAPVSLALLCALLGQRSERRRSLWLLAASGLLLGLVTGLKLTNGVYAAAMLAAVLAIGWPAGRLASVAALAAGGAAGFLAGGGWWAWFLWSEYGNPFFPYFNGLFRSPVAEGMPEAIRQGHAADIRYIPSGPLWALAYPFAWAKGAALVSSELPFRDARFALLLLLAPVAAALSVRRRGQADAADKGLSRRRMLAWTFFGSAFAIWIGTFAIHRYLIPVEILTGVMLMLLFLAMIRSRSAALVAFTLVSAWLITWGRHPDWGHVPFQSRMVPSLASSELYAPGAMFVLAGDQPLGFAAAAMPRDVRLVRVGGNLPMWPVAGLGHQAHRAIANHRGPLRSLGFEPSTPDEAQAYRNFGLSRTGRCRSEIVYGKTLVSCDLHYSPPSRADLGWPPKRELCSGSCAVARALPLLGGD
jgi:hypothetical protein